MAHSSSKITTKNMIMVAGTTQSFIIGSDSNTLNNPMIRRGGANLLQIATAGEAALDGYPATGSLSDLHARQVYIGSQPPPSLAYNVQLHRKGQGELEVLTGDSTFGDSAAAYSYRANVNVKSVTVGKDSTTSNNVRLHRCGSGMVQFITGQDEPSVAVDGQVSNSYATLLGSSPIGSIILWVPGYYTSGSNAGMTGVLSGNTVSAANAYLNPMGWYVCNGAQLNIPGNLIFSGAGRYLPSMTAPTGASFYIMRVF